MRSVDARPPGPRPQRQRPRRWLRLLWVLPAALLIGAGLRGGALLPTTIEDFTLSGTRSGVLPPYTISTSDNCMGCHGPMDGQVDPAATWRTSKKAYTADNPLFFAQMALANQDASNAGYYCLRCHVPMSFVSGTALSDPSGESLTHEDMDGITCHFCHSLVDPIYKPGISPEEDFEILAMLDDSVPEYYANGMYVLDPEGQRRGPRPDAAAMHEFIYSPFHTTGALCGTCHDVGNIAISLQADGTYRYNAIDEQVPDENPYTHFPLQRTYSEWKLSAFNNGGVDMGGRFGGDGHPTGIINNCQDCHMPRTFGKPCYFLPPRPDLAQHKFAGAGVWSFEILQIFYQDDPDIDHEALEIGRLNALDMLQRAASLDVEQSCQTLHVRVYNETGHKLPTGHVEGRRAWVNVKLFDADDELVCEFGGYDYDEALLDEAGTRVYEMHNGLSDEAAAELGLEPGEERMVLADTIKKDTRIPPRGFNNEAFAAAGAPVVGHSYADGQYWDDLIFDIPESAVRAEVTLNYQMVTRAYIEQLRDGNVTNHWGDTLHDLWLETDKAPPVAMVSDEIVFLANPPADLNCDGVVNVQDLLEVISHWGARCPRRPGGGRCPGDANGDGQVDVQDLLMVIMNWGATG